MWDVNRQRALDLVTRLMAIPGRSGEEGAVAALIESELQAAGVPASAIQYDSANRRSPIGGQVGNLIVKLPGSRRGPRRLLMAHMDTVPLCVGSQPVQRGEWIESSDPATALGGDNRAGCAVVLTAVRELLEQEVAHPPLTMLWTVQEEIGLVGARHLTLSKLGKPAMGFNWDGSDPGSVIIGATGTVHVDIRIRGIASHAGAHPEDGVNAAVVAARALGSLADDGWHGQIVKARQSGTSNLGKIHGGAATNVVLDDLRIEAEIRSHSSAFRERIVAAWRKAFEAAVRTTRNQSGQTGSVEFTPTLKYESFRLKPAEPVVSLAREVLRKLDIPDHVRSCDGGLDANWMCEYGLPTVTLGCGQAGIHTTSERLKISQFLDACRVGLNLAAAVER